ncbi:MAG TPA: hypothetical protein VGD01_08325 [Candidatus Elarobacter sp.]|jgi:hypothetical protein
MPDPADLPALRFARRAENDHTLLQGAWPAAVRIVAARASSDAALTVHTFAAAFAPISDARLRRFALACRLLSDIPRLAPDGALAAQLEQHAILAELFPGDPRVWTALREITARAAWARAEDELYRSGRRDIAELDEPAATAHARASVVLPRFAAAGLALLAGDETALPAWERGIDAYAEARARLAAVIACRDDVAAGRATYVSARLAREEPTAYAEARIGAPDVLAVRLYAGGIAAEMIDRALAALAVAHETLPHPVAAEWRELTALARRAASARVLLDEARAIVR